MPASDYQTKKHWVLARISISFLKSKLRMPTSYCTMPASYDQMKKYWVLWSHPQFFPKKTNYKCLHLIFKWIIKCFNHILISFLKINKLHYACILLSNEWVLWSHPHFFPKKTNFEFLHLIFKWIIECFARIIISFLKNQTAQCLHLMFKWRSIECFGKSNSHFFLK